MKYATRDKFVRSSAALGIAEEFAGPAFERLVRNHTEIYRHYHTLQHVDSMLGDLDGISSGNPEIEMAIWFHDSIYDPRARDNETRSAALFVKCLGSHVASVACVNIVRLVLTTDHTRQRSGNPEEDLIRDIDLSVLASSREDYLGYAAAIRQEYAYVPEIDFARGRLDILTKFLQSQIFHSGEFKSLEDAARKNIEAELTSWQDRVR